LKNKFDEEVTGPGRRSEGDGYQQAREGNRKNLLTLRSQSKGPGVYS